MGVRACTRCYAGMGWSRTTSGSHGSIAGKACRCGLGAAPARRATYEADIPGCIVSSTSRTFSAAGQPRRRCTDVITSTRDARTLASEAMAVVIGVCLCLIALRSLSGRNRVQSTQPEGLCKKSRRSRRKMVALAGTGQAAANLKTRCHDQPRVECERGGEGVPARPPVDRYRNALIFNPSGAPLRRSSRGCSGRGDGTGRRCGRVSGASYLRPRYLRVRSPPTNGRQAQVGSTRH
jgi:hypothetical protein